MVICLQNVPKPNLELLGCYRDLFGVCFFLSVCLFSYCPSTVLFTSGNELFVKSKTDITHVEVVLSRAKSFNRHTKNLQKFHLQDFASFI